ncbi:MAG TPA: hypothetical protein VGG19_14050 [Tepidisphaeraceae bacterium]|jgi:hypothetical protein
MEKARRNIIIVLIVAIAGFVSFLSDIFNVENHVRIMPAVSPSIKQKLNGVFGPVAEGAGLEPSLMETAKGTKTDNSDQPQHVPIHSQNSGEQIPQPAPLSHKPSLCVKISGRRDTVCFYPLVIMPHDMPNPMVIDADDVLATVGATSDTRIVLEISGNRNKIKIPPWMNDNNIQIKSRDQSNQIEHTAF